MSLETPNNLAAAIVFFYADEDASSVIITAVTGVTSLRLLSDPGDPPQLEEGFFLDLQQKITPDIGTFSLLGYQEFDNLNALGFTPFVEIIGDTPEIEALTQTQGNWMIEADSELNDAPGLIQLLMWTTPPTGLQPGVTLPIPP